MPKKQILLSLIAVMSPLIFGKAAEDKCSSIETYLAGERDWMKNIRGLGVRMYRKGEIRRAEALSQSNYQSAIRYLEDVNIVTALEVQDKKEKHFIKRYALTDNKVQLESLRRRLFKFL